MIHKPSTSKFPGRKIQTRRGAILPLVAIIMPVMLILLGISVDLAYIQNTRMELRAATDAAARAAATRLSQTDDITLARERAKLVASRNFVAGKNLVLEDSDITFGRSEPNAAGRWIFNEAGTPPNSVRVLSQRTSDSGGAIPLFFGSFTGQAGFETRQTATASFLNVDICLVLDRSSSMKLGVDSEERGMGSSDPRFCESPNSQSRWVALDRAMRIFVQTLQNSNAEEQVALVTYSSDDLKSLCGASTNPSSLDAPLATDLSRITGEMDRLGDEVWNGNTFIESGMRTGLSALTDPTRSRQFANKIMIVLTDGHENEGSATSAARACLNKQIVVNSITFGDFADQVIMAQVARTGGGRHYHASDGAALERIFRELAAKISRLTE